MADRIIDSDLLIKGRSDSTEAKIKTTSEKIIKIDNDFNVSGDTTFADVTATNLTTTADVNVGGELDIGGIDVRSYMYELSPSQVFTSADAPGYEDLEVEHYTVEVNVDGAEGPSRLIGISMPSAAAIHPKSYKIHVKGLKGGAGDQKSGRVNFKTTGTDRINGKARGATIAAYAIMENGIYYVSSKKDDPSEGIYNWIFHSSHADSHLHSIYTRPVVAATTSNVTLASLQEDSVIDGVTLKHGDRVLVKNQSTESENGIYDIYDGSAPLRTHDFVTDESVHFKKIPVTAGTNGANKIYQVNNLAGDAIVGTSNLNIDLPYHTPFTERANVTQPTSITTSVTANSTHGRITVFNTTMASNASNTFTVNNSFSLVSDNIFLQQRDADGFFTLCVANVLNGSFDIKIQNVSSTSKSTGGLKIYFIIVP